MLISWNTSFLYSTTLVINLWSIPCQLLFHLDIASHLELLWSLAIKSMNDEHTEANKLAPCMHLSLAGDDIMVTSCLCGH
jgi:hypothetical protein